MNSEELECTVYKSLKKDETYIYLPSTEAITSLPKQLLGVLGQTEKVMELSITPEKKLARYLGKEILDSIKEQGFHLQMPDNPHLNENLLPTKNERFLDKNL